MAERALLRAAGEAHEEPFLVIDSAWTVLTANEAAKEVFGANLEGGPLVRAFRHPDALEAVSSVLGGRERARVEFPVWSPNPIMYRLSVMPLAGRDAGEAAVALSLRDVSHLQAAQQMRRDFVANVSHELRSPLTTLSGLIETLSGSARDDPEANDRFLAIMAREAARMDRLIDDLLSLSRVEADEKVRPVARVDLASVARGAVATIAEGAGASHRLDLHLPEGECAVRGDEGQLVQIFHNLVENAVKYSPEGSAVSVSIEAVEKAAHFADPVWRISVRDEGPGIAPEHLPRLTERFYRVDSGRSRMLGGTGLGLAIVKHIVNRHRGRLRIESMPGEGTTVTVFLPRA